MALASDKNVDETLWFGEYLKIPEETSYDEKLILGHPLLARITSHCRLGCF